MLKALIGVLDAESKRKFSIIASYANFYDDCTVTQTLYDTELALNGHDNFMDIKFPKVNFRSLIRGK